MAYRCYLTCFTGVAFSFRGWVLGSLTGSVMKLLKSARESSFYQFLKGYASHAAERIKELVRFDLSSEFSQRKLIELGKVISRIVSMDLVLYLEEKGFRKDLIENTLIILKQDISTLLNTFHFENNAQVIVEYKEDSNWLDFSY